MGYEKDYRSADVNSVEQVTLTKVYGWMTLALAVSAIAALYTAQTPQLAQLLFGSRLSLLVGFGIEIGLVIYLSARIMKMSFMTAATCFGLYSVVNGMFLSSIFFLYDPRVITLAFGTTAATFGVMSLVGATTKKDLSSIGSYLMMGLVGVIIASVVNWFLKSPALYYVITYVGLFIFVGLTAYDTQKIKAMLRYGSMSGLDTRNIGIIGALNLYLDFVNIFLYLLRVFGNSRD